MKQKTTKEEQRDGIVKIDEGQIKEHLNEMYWQQLEETLNALLDAEADQLCGARVANLGF